MAETLDVWGLLVAGVPPSIWAFVGGVLALVVFSWVVIWRLYHSFIMRLRSDVDKVQVKHDGDINTVYDRLQEAEAKMLGRLDQQAESQARQTELLSQRLDEMNRHLIDIATNTRHRYHSGDFNDDEHER